MTISTMRRPASWGLAVSLLVVVAACEQRLATTDEPPHLQWCTWVNAAQVYDEQGNPLGLVLDQDGNQTELCWCLTGEQGKSGDWDDEVNDLAYEVCLRNAAQMGYPETNDCADWHATGHWGGVMFRTWPLDEPAECDPDVDSAAGCSVR